MNVEYTPQQNGIAERANRTLVEMARYMLIQSKLSKSLWAEAINTAVFIRNRCPSKQLTETTPIEMWSNKKPYVEFMRIFGSKVIALNKGPRLNKFEAKGELYLLVGYSDESKIYRLWKPGTRKVIKRRDVRFDEKLSEENTKKVDYFEAPLNVLEIISKPLNVEIIEDETENNTEESKHEDQASYEKEPANTSDTSDEITTIKRAPDRPKIIRTGKRGRPRKLFHETANSAYIEDINEPHNIKDIFSREDKEL